MPFDYLIILPFTLSSIIFSIPIRNVFEPSEGWFQIEACKFGWLWDSVLYQYLVLK